MHRYGFRKSATFVTPIVNWKLSISKDVSHICPLHLDENVTICKHAYKVSVWYSIPCIASVSALVSVRFEVYFFVFLLSSWMVVKRQMKVNTVSQKQVSLTSRPFLCSTLSATAKHCRREQLVIDLICTEIRRRHI